MDGAARDLALFALIVALACGWISVRTARTPVTSPDRLILELRLSQVAASMLVFVSGAWAGISVLSGTDIRAVVDTVAAVMFFLAALTSFLRDPGHALRLLGNAFGIHALIDMLHRPGYLLEVAPLWFVIGCAVVNVILGALCYYPLLHRRA